MWFGSTTDDLVTRQNYVSGVVKADGITDACIRDRMIVIACIATETGAATKPLRSFGVNDGDVQRARCDRKE